VSFVKKIKNKINKLIISDVLFPENLQLLEDYGGFRKSIILCTGPSINQVDFDFNKNDLIISVANFHEHIEIEKINPHIHIFAASHPPITETVFFQWFLRCHKRLPKQTAILVEKRDFNIAKKSFKERKIYTYSYGGNFPIDFTKRIKPPLSVSQIAMQLGIYVNCKKIFFYGIDLHWRLLDSYSHFYSHNKPSLEYYLKKEGIKVFHEEETDLSKETLYYVHKVYKSFETIKEEGIKNDSIIVNGNETSKFDIFPYESYK
jgi:hypothetical protein